MDIKKNRILFLSCNSIFGMYKLLGNLMYLEDENYFNTIDTFSGCGLAILIAAFLSLKYKVRDIICYFVKFLPLKDYFIEFGYSDIINVDNIFYSTYTLGDLYINTGNSLVIPIYDRTLRDVKIMNYRDNHSLLIKDLLKIAISNPYSSEDNETSMVNITMFPIDIFPTEVNILSIVISHRTQTLYLIKNYNRDNLIIFMLDDDDEFILDYNQIGKCISEGYLMRIPFTERLSDIKYKVSKNSIKIT